MNDSQSAVAKGHAVEKPPGVSATGLSETEARLRLERDGPNRLPHPQHKSVLSLVGTVALQPMVVLLLACTLLYAVLGSLGDSAVLGLSIVAVAAISVYQELRTQRVLEALRDLASPRSTVLRDGAVKRISSQELVQGDRLIIEEGDRLACDARLVEAHGMRVDESLLTGESVPIDKTCFGDGDAARSLHAGTLVVQGDGMADVTATGIRTALGQIGHSLASMAPRPSRLQEQLKRLVRVVAIVALLTCVLAATAFALREDSWTAGLLVGLTLAMSIIPEEFAVVWTVMLALGAWRLARAQVLTRQPQAIEALGTTTVLAVDKTGTLTCNQMEIAALDDGQHSLERGPNDPVPVSFTPLLKNAGLASVAEGLEPMDRAIFRLLPPSDRTASARLLLREGVMPGHPFVRQGWRFDDGQPDLLVLKGAPEALLTRCTGDGLRVRRLQRQAETWAARGMRVIAVARLQRVGADVANADDGYEAVGLLAFEDPLRADVPAALDECRQAGMRVVMITGDAPATAVAIACQSGLLQQLSADAVLTGAQIDVLNEAAFELAVGRVAVYARVSPAQKLRIVQALQRRGEVVAMTGDGVNDGPALRAADIGVAMGERGTDVAREAAALVLLDDRFGSLVDAVRAGRRIFTNLQKAMGYLFAVHVPIVGLSLLPILGGPVLLLPVHVIALELIIDPACSLVFEAEPPAADAMKRPPRPTDAPLFSGGALLHALLVGAVALLAVVAVQWLGHLASLSDEALRLAAIATIVAGNVGMLQWFRASTHRRRVHSDNRIFLILLLAILGLSLAVLLLAPLRAAFGFPSTLAATWTVGLLGVPAAWVAWRLAVGNAEPST